MAITPLPPAPLPTDTPAEFNEKAFDLVAALEDFVTETNALAVAVDADATAADADAATALTQAGIATTKAGEALASANAAAASEAEAAGLVEKYQGSHSSDPSVDKDGNPLTAGDWYVNSSTGLIRAYTGSAWVTSVNVTAGVSSFSAGSTGLTPSTLTQGDITLSGTLAVANGGTGLTSPGTSGNILVSNGTGFTSTAPTPGMPIGALSYFSSSTIPDSSWKFCDGTVYTKTSLTALAAAIGNIPNYWSAGPVEYALIASQSGLDNVDFRIGASSTHYFVHRLTQYCGSYGKSGWTSTNGVTWSGADTPTQWCNDLSYGGSLWLFVGYTSAGVGTDAVYTSADNGQNWTQRLTGTYYSARYCNDKYIAVGHAGALQTSTNGTTWTARTSNTTSSIISIAYGNGTYVYVGAGGALGTSTDGITWTARTSGTSSDLNNLVYANNKFIATGGQSSTSTDGITWDTFRSTTRNINRNTIVSDDNGNVYGTTGTYCLWGGSGFNWSIYRDNIGSIAIRSGSSVLRTISRSGWDLRYNDYNPFTYTPSTQFVLPTQNATATTNTLGIIKDNSYNLFIKATA